MIISDRAKKLLAEAGTSQNQLWGAIASVAGLIISAASVLTAMTDKKEKVAFILVVITGTLVILFILACSINQKNHYLSLLEGEIRKEQTDSVSHQNAWRCAERVPKLELWAIRFVAMETVVFVYLCSKLVAAP